MANDLTALTTLVTGDLTRTDITSAQVQTDIKSAVRDYEAYRFYFNERAITITISATSTYALALFAAASSGVSDIIEIDNMSVTVTGTVQDLDEISFREYRQLAINSTLTGYPTKYATNGQNVYLYPTPNGTYSVTMDAHVKFTELSAGTDSNAWTLDARELIRCATLKRLWGRLIKDPQQAQMMQEGENQALAALQRRTDALSGHTIAAYL